MCLLMTKAPRARAANDRGRDRRLWLSARALVFEQRVREPLAIRDMRRLVNGGRRPRHINSRLEFSFPLPSIDVQNSTRAVPEFLRCGAQGRTAFQPSLGL